jgi:uncharacterized SAM-binding protein YcdF (DUF218 family)
LEIVLMFIFSKLVWILGQPLSLAFIFCALGLLASIFRWRITSVATMAVSTAILFIALFTSMGAYLVQGLEDRFPHPQGDPSDLKCMIVLGGGFDTDVDTYRGGYNVGDAGDRFIEAMRLALKYPHSRILVSGGAGSISGDLLGDAVISQRMFSAFGIGKDRIIGDKESRTTFENTVNTKELLDSNDMSNCFLITSGFHMPRAVGIFRRFGIEVVPWVVDYRATGREHLRLDFTQPLVNAQHLSTAVREWVGMVGYYAVGRTSALYPAP